MRTNASYIIIVFLSLNKPAPAQDTLSPIEMSIVLKIDELVLAIDKDSTMFIVNQDETDVTAFYKNNSLQKILSPGSLYIAFETQAFYFNDSQLIYYERNYYNMSRMGSCGGLDIQTTYYFLNKKIINQTMHESPYECYNDPFLSENEIFERLDGVLNKL